MDVELNCNILRCRKPLSDKAVVTTCSHIFCLECANENFQQKLCPACETRLTEPDDVVLCSLQPTNDYKTSVLSGLSPNLILEICSRYIKKGKSTPTALLKNANENNDTLTKQMENVIREANSELSLLQNKCDQLGRDLDLEKKRTRELADSMRDREKDHQRLKVQLDTIKRKALIPHNPLMNGIPSSSNAGPNPTIEGYQRFENRTINNGAHLVGLSMGDVASGMNFNKVQRTPLRPAPDGGFQDTQGQGIVPWQQQQTVQKRVQKTGSGSFDIPGAGSESDDVVEILVGPGRHGPTPGNIRSTGGFTIPQNQGQLRSHGVATPMTRRISQGQQVANPGNRKPGVFRPASFLNR